MNVAPLAQLLVRRPKTVLLAFTLVTTFIGLQSSNIYMESDFTSFLPSDDPTIELWNIIDKEFQIGSTIIIYVEADDIRDSHVLKEMERVSLKINKYENDKGKQDGILSVQSIVSLIKAENAKPYVIGGLGGTSRNEIPEDENLISSYIARAPVQEAKGVLFTNTYKVAVIIFQLDEEVDYTSILNRVDAAIDQRGTSFCRMTVTGTIAMQNAIQKTSMQKLLIIFPIALILVSATLFFFHRTIKGVIIAFLPPAYALALTFGFLGFLQPELTLLSIAVIALLMGLGVDYSIHLMNRFAEEHTLRGKRERIEKTLQSTGKAVFLSTITTMIGFGSLMISGMPPIVSFGFSCVIGIFFCFTSAIILVPCLALILKFEKNGTVYNWRKLASFTIKNQKRVIVIAVFFAVVSLVVLPQVETDVNYLDMAPEGIPEVEKLYEYSDKFGGGTNFNALLVETEPQGLTYPNVIDAIYDMEVKIRSLGVSVYSIADEIKKLHDIMERKTIIEKLSELLEVEEIIVDRVAREGVVTDDFSKTIVLVSVPVGKSMGEIEEIVNRINSIAARTAIPHDGRVSRLTGQDAVNVAVNKRLTDEQTRSMIIALLLVLAVLILIFNSSLYGFLTLIPVFFVLLWEPGFLVALDIPLSVITISIASIMIGIGIDYGIHITQRVREGLNSGLPKIEAIREAIEKTGLSLLEAASTTIAGLLSIYFVNIPALQQFGLVVILMTGFSCIGAALILPMFYNFKFVK